MIEKWVKIKNTDRYEISSNGRVKVISFTDSIGRNKKERILKPFTTNKGYKSIGLFTTNGRKHLSVHRMVAEAFIPNVENKPQVNHKNGIKDDNRVDNLEWVTSSENMIHAYKNGKVSPSRKITDEQVIEIRKLGNEGKKSKELSDLFNVSRSYINDILAFRVRNK